MSAFCTTSLHIHTVLVALDRNNLVGIVSHYCYNLHVGDHKDGSGSSSWHNAMSMAICTGSVLQSLWQILLLLTEHSGNWNQLAVLYLRLLHRTLLASLPHFFADACVLCDVSARWRAPGDQIIPDHSIMASVIAHITFETLSLIFHTIPKPEWPVSYIGLWLWTLKFCQHFERAIAHLVSMSQFCYIVHTPDWAH